MNAKQRRQEKLKNWLDSVNFSKRNIVEEDGAEIKTYVPFLMNRI